MEKISAKILQKINSFWQCLISVGINDTIGRDETKYVRFTNVITVLTCFAVAVYIPFSLVKGNYSLALLQVIDVVSVLSVLLFNHMGHHKAARMTYLLVINSFVLLNSFFIGYAGGVQDFFYISYVTPFLLFGVRDYKNIVVGIFMAALFFGIYQAIYPLFDAYNLPMAQQITIGQINMLMKFVLFGIAIYIMAYYNYSTEKKLEASNRELQKRAAELKRSNEDLEQFAYIVSHDLKAPVRNISSFMKLLLTRFNSGFPPGAQEFVELSKTSSDRLARQIDDLLSYCRVGRNLSPASNVDLEEMVKTIRMELGEKIRESNAEVITARQLPGLKDVHSSMVHHVFQNLIANGIKFNKGANPVVTLDYEVGDDEITFSVADNGIGIEPGFESKLFQMFKRLHTQDQFEGTGIGLAVCKRIVNFYQGNIWYKSEPGNGTTFFFTLPKRMLDTSPKPAAVFEMQEVYAAA